MAQNIVSIAFSKSYELEYNKEYAKAIDAMISIYSADAYDVNLRLGWLYYINAEYIKSQGFYKSASKLLPKAVEPKLGLVYPTAALLNWNEVIKIYEDILVLDPNNTKANYQLAYIYYVRKDFKKAHSYVKKVYDLYPFDYDSNVLLTRLNISLGDITEAKNNLNKALNCSPNSIEAIDIMKKM